MHVHYVFVRQYLRFAGLALQRDQRVRVPLELRAEDFDRDMRIAILHFLVQAVDGPVDDAHPAFAENRLQLEAPAHDGADFDR